MKAQIFYLAGKQKALSGEIAALLRRIVYGDLTVEELAVPDRDPEGADEDARWAAQTYVDLLKSSMVKVNDFTISVEDPEGPPWYMGYEGPTAVILKKESLTSILPAVAVMGRMVMLPKGVQEALDCPTGFSCFPKPLDVQGVTLVDFRDVQSRLNAAHQVEAQISSEIVSLCRRYMFMNKIRQPEFDDGLAEMIGVETEYLRRHRDEILEVSVELEPKVMSGPVRLGQQSRVVLEISKPPEKALGQVSVQVTGPSDTMAEPKVCHLDFSAGDGDARQIEFDVTAWAHPFCPLEVIFEPSEATDACPPFPIPVILDVVES